MPFAALEERQLDKKYAFPSTIISLISSLGISELFFEFNERTIEEIAPYELFGVIEYVREKARKIQSEIDEMERQKKNTIRMVVEGGGNINKVMTSIELLLTVENPLRRKLVCLEFIIEWIENLIEKQKSKA